MIIVTTHLTNRRIAFGLFAAILAAVAAAAYLSKAKLPREEPLLLTNEDRVAYLTELGWNVESNPLETLQFLLGDQLEEPFLSYNQMQLEQGYDLTEVLGKQLTRYTYAIQDGQSATGPVQVNLYLCDGLPVAGDVCSPGENGFQLPLLPNEKKTAA